MRNTILAAWENDEPPKGVIIVIVLIVIGVILWMLRRQDSTNEQNENDEPLVDDTSRTYNQSSSSTYAPRIEVPTEQEKEDERLYDEINKLVVYFVTKMQGINLGLTNPPPKGCIHDFASSGSPLYRLPMYIKAVRAWWSPSPGIPIATSYVCITPDGQWEYMGHYHFYKETDPTERFGFWIASSEYFRPFILEREENNMYGKRVRHFAQYLDHFLLEDVSHTATFRDAYAAVRKLIVTILEEHYPAALSDLPPMP